MGSWEHRGVIAGLLGDPLNNYIEPFSRNSGMCPKSFASLAWSPGSTWKPLKQVRASTAPAGVGSCCNCNPLVPRSLSLLETVGQISRTVRKKLHHTVGCLHAHHHELVFQEPKKRVFGSDGIA